MKYFLKLDDMTQKEKFLLLQDLCARLPYGVKIFHEITDETGNTHTYDGYILHELSNDGQHITLLNYDDKHGVCEVDVECGVFKPYLRPMSSMTEEEKRELEKIIDGILGYNVKNYFHSEDDYNWNTLYNTEDWLNSHGFDYRNLIPKGLALEALPGMY